ncbi:tripartite tricarboxylate transporter TctB family protein [Leucobacter insecticola]|uniref:Tripartite tricarboxylate transporter TctB family protein n=1 Tax=Leucobacter insecticola TaxID=2714934 RepID=A0A6G8FGA8_9MICO|nr:tripartite tricarboxylate transporter TctB family protein [Leucobacter insecticola]QIM15431.1 tripartite tricarboxylate transporter TctB family protein [Leucobacter insecticola]
MTTSTQLNTEAIRVQRTPRWYTGRSELIVAAGVFALAGLLGYGTATMEVPEGTSWPGPQFFPTIVTAFLAVTAIALAVEVLRSSRRLHSAADATELSDAMLHDLGQIDATSELRVISPEMTVQRETGDGQPGTTSVGIAQPGNTEPSAEQRSDTTTVLVVLGMLAGFIVVMPFAGWLVSSAALFWGLAWAFGSKRGLFDVALAALIAGAIQLAFSAGLGLNLPAGILEGVFSWIN